MSSPRILVIDDSKAVRRIAMQALSAFDCTVNEATNGFTGLFAMERALPQLLVIDVSTPTMDGVEMLEMIKGNDQLKGIPVIMLTSATDWKRWPRIDELGADTRLQKPFQPAAFIEAVQKLIKLKAAKAAK